MIDRSLLVFVVLLGSIFFITQQGKKSEKIEKLPDKVTLNYCGEKFKVDRSFVRIYYRPHNWMFNNIVVSWEYLSRLEEFSKIEKTIYNKYEISRSVKTFGKIYENCNDYTHAFIEASKYKLIKKSNFTIEGISFHNCCEFLFPENPDNGVIYVVNGKDVLSFYYRDGKLVGIMMRVRLDIPAILTFNVHLDVGERLKNGIEWISLNRDIRSMIRKIIIKGVN